MTTEPSAARSAARLPHYRTVCSDVIEQLTEGSVYCLTSAYDNDAGSSRSYLGWEPVITFTAFPSGSTSVTENGITTESKSDPLSALQLLLDRFQNSASQPLCISFFSYDLRTHIERFDSPIADDLETPLIHIALFDTYWEIDHLNEVSEVVSVDVLDSRPSAQNRAFAFRQVLEKALTRVSPLPTGGSAQEGPRIPNGFTSHFDRAQYMSNIDKAHEHILSGDIYQVNLSQRFSGPLDIPPRRMFRWLMDSTPSPFAAYVELPGMTVLSSSPERLLKVENGIVETRPIKGTRPRGATESEDVELREELLASAKDRAENVMIVDVERNDLGRVCEIGSIDASTLLELESYPQVHHLVSVVTGELPKEVGLTDILRATFPGGSISGAPKIRAMQIIDELEGVGRGAYTGSVGRFDFNGTLDLNILIRTLIIKDGQAHLSVGGGIVADSDPESEYEETLHKAAGVFDAIKRANRWS